MNFKHAHIASITSCDFSNINRACLKMTLGSSQYLISPIDIFRSKRAMPTAYVLINCDANRRDAVINELHQLPSVTEVEEIHGAYDMLIKLKQGSVEELKETIKWRLKKIPEIKSTVTLIAIEEASKKSPILKG